jgi:hypothetical protein
MLDIWYEKTMNFCCVEPLRLDPFGDNLIHSDYSTLMCSHPYHQRPQKYAQSHVANPAQSRVPLLFHAILWRTHDMVYTSLAVVVTFIFICCPLIAKAMGIIGSLILYWKIFGCEDSRIDCMWYQYLDTLHCCHLPEWYSDSLCLPATDSALLDIR